MTSFLPIQPGTRELGSGDFHLWLARLDDLRQIAREAAQILSSEEVQRGARFRFKQDQERFKSARALLRLLLGGYLQVRPESLQFRMNAFGKPHLDKGRGLEFNLSHSAGWALYGFVWRRRVGVDIEQVRADFATPDVAARYFAEAEACELRRLPDHLRVQGFFNCWTRKEAFVKALGEGLSCPLNTFEVTIAPGEAARLVKSIGTGIWSLLHLDPAPGMVAAAVVEGEGLNTSCFRVSS